MKIRQNKICYQRWIIGWTISTICAFIQKDATWMICDRNNWIYARKEYIADSSSSCRWENKTGKCGPSFAERQPKRYTYRPKSAMTSSIHQGTMWFTNKILLQTEHKNSITLYTACVRWQESPITGMRILKHFTRDFSECICLWI